jgi:hypothetical protein
VDDESVVDLHVVPPDDFCMGLQEAIQIAEARKDALEFALEEMAEGGLDEYHLDLFQTRVNLVAGLIESFTSAMQEHIANLAELQPN